MNPRTFCTIITPDYLPYALALHHSLEKHAKVSFDFNVLIACQSSEFEIPENISPEIKFLFVDQLCKSGVGAKIFQKYYNGHMDEFRWSMKPVLVNYLIQVSAYEKVILVDSDIFFFSDFEFLFDALDSSAVLLTPHWRSSDPHLDPANFQILFNCGLYNAGFVGANKNATQAMDWWASACEYVCIKDPSRGYFVDQTHLNLFHIMFEGVEVLRHRGCNIANWNQIECKRVLKESGSLWINSEYPVIFVHFTKSTIQGILSGEDALLLPHLEEYMGTLKNYNPDPEITKKGKNHQIQSKKSTILSRILHWLKI
jgi:hypothetical protein